MPDFTHRPDAPLAPIKLLYLGHTGAGKTGSLCSLAAAGYTVRILDLDGGVEILRDFLNNPASPYLKASPGLWTEAQAKSIRDRISYCTITEGYNIQGVKAIPKADAWPRLNGQLNSWTDGESKYGNISTWGEDIILVIDGLSRLCEAAMHFQLAINGRLATGPQVGNSGSNDYSGAYRLILDFLDLLKSSDIRCHIIMICHIRFQVEMQADPTNKQAVHEQRGFPQTVGRMISPTVGQYFNHALRAKSIGDGPSTQRVIVTNNDDAIDLKNVAPLRVKQQYKLGTGLAEYFRDVRGGGVL